MGSKILAFLQRIGKSLMMPIAVLPAAALLLRFGAPDMLNLPLLAKAGQAVFDNLPLLFAIGVALGFAKDAGAAALSAAVGYFVAIAAGKQTYALLLPPGSEHLADKFDLGVLPGILIGLLAGILYQRYHKVKLPRFLGFFGGKRFVPILTSLVAVALGAVLGLIYPPVSHGLQTTGNWILGAGPVGAFVYGVANRLLIPFGFHHIINTLLWFQFGSYTAADGTVVHGEITRFLAGDPTAGGFLAGFYPIMMFGLPAAALAMLHEAKPANYKIASGILISAALTSLVTGITEPIEFSFMFLAPLLYLVHSLLTGGALALCYAFGARDAFGFSAGLIDYLLNFNLAARPLLLLGVGVVTGVFYYVLFRWAIRKFDLKTPGREDEDLAAD